MSEPLPPPEPNVRRHFLGWDGPLGTRAAAWFARDWTRGPLDLSGQLVLVPTRQSGRILREELARLTAARGGAVLSPEILTPEVFVETVAGASLPAGMTLAGEIDVLAAWISVLVRLRFADFAAVFPVEPPVADFAWATAVGRQLQHARATLAESGKSFGLVGASEDVPETERWRQLARLEALYLGELTSAGLWDPEAAKIAALEQPRWPWTAQRVVLAGVPDPLPIACELLARAGAEVEALVWAPAGRESWFDAFGRPLPGPWSGAEIPLEPPVVHLHSTADAAAQARAVAALLPAHEAPDLTLALAVADPSLARPVENALLAEGQPVFRPEGQSAAHHPLPRLLTAWKEALGDDWRTFVRLLRQPPVLSALEKDSRLLADADDFHARHFPVRLTDVEAVADPTVTADAVVRHAAGTVLRRVREFGRGPLPEALAAWFAWLFPAGNDPAWRDLAAQAAELAGEIERALPRASRSDQLMLLLSVLGRGRLSRDRPERAVELGGWLELPWRGAPHLVVAGFNDSFVPASPAPDPFLPDGLRERLGLRCHQTRVARDSFLLAAMVASRAGGGRVDLFFAQTGAGEEVLRPSRLLFRCPDEALPARVQALFAEPPPATAPPPERAWKLRPQAAAALASPAKLGVTSLGTYLACPFRFFLKHVLRMREVEPDRQELDPLAFGNLCHSAFEALARDESARRSTDPGVIAGCLLSSLDATVRSLFGPRQPLSLQLQIDTARQRLTKAAEVQAEVQRQGWVIESVEKDLSELRGEPWVLGGVEIRGRVDRLEVNQRTGEWRIVDYKTAAKAKTPAEMHTARAGSTEWPHWRVLPTGDRVWAGLQLPLYGAALMDRHGPLYRAAYFNLPKALGETSLADWTELDAALLASAVECAHGVLRAIAGHVFWPPVEKPPFDDFDALWLQGVAATCEPPEIIASPVTEVALSVSPPPPPPASRTSVARKTAPAQQLELDLFGGGQ